MCAVTALDHFEAEVLPDRLLHRLAEGHQEADCKRVRNRLRRVWRLMVLDPGNEANEEDGLIKVIHHECCPHRVKLGELPSIDREHALHKSILVHRVLRPEVLDVLFKQFGLVADLQSVGKFSILLKADLLLHGTIHQRPCIAIGDFGPQA